MLVNDVEDEKEYDGLEVKGEDQDEDWEEDEVERSEQGADEDQESVEEVSQDGEEDEGVKESNEFFDEDDEGAEEEPAVEADGGVQEEEAGEDDQEEDVDPHDGDGDQNGDKDEDQDKFEWLGYSSAFDNVLDHDVNQLQQSVDTTQQSQQQHQVDTMQLVEVASGYHASPYGYHTTFTAIGRSSALAVFVVLEVGDIATIFGVHANKNARLCGNKDCCFGGKDGSNEQSNHNNNRRSNEQGNHKCNRSNEEDHAGSFIEMHQAFLGKQREIEEAAAPKFDATHTRMEAGNMASKEQYENLLSQTVGEFERQFINNLKLSYATFDSRVDKLEAHMLGRGDARMITLSDLVAIGVSIEAKGKEES
ncbi:hypothetical protein Scep_014762 [Stephania cephalantha]|uniref:Uncharacterized protein n=1 Tax=Stephania cephalantha TaxID=152367 RepID=A0AAP0J1S7_9MAGN